MQCTFAARCLNRDKDKITKTWCYNAKYVQQSFSIPTHLQNMDQMKLQFKEYTVLSKPYWEDAITIQRLNNITKNHIDGIIVL